MQVTWDGADNVRFGSLADKRSQAEIRLCPPLSVSAQTGAQLDCPLSADSDIPAEPQRSGSNGQFRQKSLNRVGDNSVYLTVLNVAVA